MADAKLSALTPTITDPVDADVIYIVTDVATVPSSEGVTMGDFLGNTGDVAPRTDNTSALGSATKGYTKLICSPATFAASQRDGFRGLHVYFTSTDVYSGADNLFPGYFSQRVVLANDSVGDNSNDVTSIYQGNLDEPVILVNYFIGSATQVTTSFAAYGTGGLQADDGLTLFGAYDATATLGGGGIGLHARYLKSGFLAQFESDVFTMRTGTTAMGGNAIVGWRIGGSDCDYIAPSDKTGAINHNAIDLGVVDTNEWKDLFLAGQAQIGGALNHDGTTLGVFNTAPTTKQTVTGSRGGNAALASLLTALAAYSLITDSTT
jgi:hypothetical protein